MPYLTVYTLLVVEDEGQELYIDACGATIYDKHSYSFNDVETAGRAYNNAKECVQNEEAND